MMVEDFDVQITKTSCKVNSLQQRLEAEKTLLRLLKRGRELETEASKKKVPAFENRIVTRSCTSAAN